MKFSTPGSPFHQIWTLYEPIWGFSQQASIQGTILVPRTRLREGDDIGNIGHEDAPLELELCVLVPYFGARGTRLVLLVFALVGIDLLATEENAFKEVDLVLRAVSQRIWAMHIMLTVVRRGETTHVLLLFCLPRHNSVASMLQ